MPDRLIDRLDPKDPFHSLDGFVTAQRTRAELDSIFEFDSNELERNDVKVTDTADGANVKKTRNLTDDEFETYREQASESRKLNYNPRSKSYTVKASRLETPDPLEVHVSRDRETMQNDKQRKARVTTDPELYASDPESYDFPLLDTPDEFEDEISSLDPAGDIKRKAGDDDLFTW